MFYCINIIRFNIMFVNGYKIEPLADLSGADLSGAKLNRANLWSAKLSESDLSDANLRGANLSESDLSDANLRGANLREADLSDANLRGADLRGADLGGADLREADLRWTILKNCILFGTIGNKKEVKSAQFDEYSLTWIMTEDTPILQIGCQRHNLEWWKTASDDVIKVMDCKALEWWKKYKDIIISLVELSPAVSTK